MMARGAVGSSSYFYCGLEGEASLKRLGHRRWTVGLIIVLSAAISLAAVRPSIAEAGRFKTGYYEGETGERCPSFAVSEGICRELSKLPISFTLTPTRITDIRVMVVEHCEDEIPPRIAIVELQRSFPLKPEWGPRAGARKVFDSQPNSNGLGRNGVLGTAWPGRVNGYISTLSKVADDSYCFASTQWKATPHTQGNSQRWPEVPAVPAEPHLDPGLLQTCTSTALERPQRKDPLRMIRAGIWPNTGFRREQAVVGSFIYDDMPEACAARYARSSEADVQILKKGRWVTTQRFVAGAGNRGGTSRILTGGGHPDIPARIPEYNTCEQGHRFHKVRIRITSHLTRPALQKSEGGHSWTYPVAVEGSCKAAALSGKRVHKLQHELFGTPLSLIHQNTK
jgi:hypothetical protein